MPVYLRGPLEPPPQTTLVLVAAMANLLGDVWFDEQNVQAQPHWEKCLNLPDTHLHLYGKQEPRQARKMGHLTVLDDNVSTAQKTARRIREDLQVRTGSLP